MGELQGGEGRRENGLTLIISEGLDERCFLEEYKVGNGV